MGRVAPLLLFVLVPLAIWPGPWALALVLLIGLRVAIALQTEEKPTEFNPAIWHADDAIRHQRLTTAMDEWRARNRLWSWTKRTAGPRWG
jgi:hypothetical protein